MKSDLGQYFTTNEDLQKACVAFCRNARKGRTPILEPSAGRGDLLAPIREAFPHAPTHAVELDTSLPALAHRTTKDQWIHGDFLTAALPRKHYRTIVGNPPYVRRGPTNLYLLFVERCVGLLSRGGELVFILPSDFFKLTGASALIKSMCEQGTFTDVFRPHSERLFAGATIDVMVVRYEKTPGMPPLCSDYPAQTSMRYTTDGGIVTFGCGQEEPGPCLGDVATIHVGLVSGCEGVYANEEHGNTQVIVGEGAVKSYVIPSGPSDPVVETYLRAHEERLLARRIRSFGPDNWFEWGALRNIGLMRTRAGEPCVYVSTLTRSETPAFAGTVQHFGAGLVCVLPKPGTKVDLPALASYLNSAPFRSQYIYSGRFKIGQRLLRFARLPSPGLP